MDNEQRKIVNKRMLLGILFAGLAALVIVVLSFGTTALLGK